MPTGYTADIEKGIDFKTYAMNCARAFGACVTIRDEPGGGEQIPEVFEPSDYHLKALERAQCELADLEAMTPEERSSAAAKCWEEAEKSRLMQLDDYKKKRIAYESMLERVKEWKPPTVEHVGLHEFMRTQIEESIKFDCNEDYCLTPAARLTGEEWAADRRARLLRNVNYHKDEHAVEVECAKNRTEWVRSLRAAL